MNLLQVVCVRILAGSDLPRQSRFVDGIGSAIEAHLYGLPEYSTHECLDVFHRHSGQRLRRNNRMEQRLNFDMFARTTSRCR